MKIIYSFGKQGHEAQMWAKEIRESSTADVEFIPFNHFDYLSWESVSDAVMLDRTYQAGNPAIIRLQQALVRLVREVGADALFVTNAPPYHPDFLRTLDLYKILHSTDDPGATYQRTIPYLHAYDHVMFCAPGYSADMNLKDKMSYAGARHADWLPLGVFDFELDLAARARSPVRDIDIVYVGACFRQKLQMIAAMKRVFGRRACIKGRFAFIHNAYLVLRHGYPGWVRKISHEQRLNLYGRAKIGFNIHWNSFGLGNQRLYHLPANGVMQICDCPELLPSVFALDKEVVGYGSLDELLDKTRYYLENESQRLLIAEAGQERVLAEYRFKQVNMRMIELIRKAQG